MHPGRPVFLPVGMKNYRPFPSPHRLNISDEQEFAVYGRSNLADSVSLGPYYIYEVEQGFGATPRLTLNTAGARALRRAFKYLL